ncbi:MAG: hypothetical protein ACREJB_18945 [Planctomycetaceae bacterium]
MQEVYAKHSVRFRYPEDWELGEEEHGEDLVITVSSPETSFWSLSLFLDRPTPQRVMETAIGAFREEYEEMDVYSPEVSVCMRDTVARDVEFVCLELINGAFLRAFQTQEFTALVLYQGTDSELSDTRRILEAITASLQCDEEESAR